MGDRSRDLTGALLLVFGAALAAGVGCGRVKADGLTDSDMPAGGGAPAGLGSGGRAWAGASGGNDAGAGLGMSQGGLSQSLGGTGGRSPNTAGQDGAGRGGADDEGGEGGAISGANCEPSLVKHESYEAVTVSDLEALRGYTRIEGDLAITGQIVNFESLSCLTEVTGSLTLRSLPIRSLDGLSNLESVGKLDIEQCGVLSSLAGLEALAHANSLWLFDNPMLSDLEALASVSFQDDVSIVNDPQLTTLVGLRGTRATRDMWIAGTSLASLHGLEQLERVDELLVEGVTGLHDLTGLGAVRSISTLRLLDNPDLESLTGLGASGVLDALYLSSDPKLVNLDALSNLLGLGQVYLDKIGVADLSALNGMSTLAKLEINECPLLSSLHGLERIDEISDTLSITKNPVLASLHGLDALADASRLRIADNLVLPTCEAERLRDRLLAATRLDFVEISNNDDAGVCP